MQPNQYVDEYGNRKPDAPEGSQNQFTTGKRTKHDESTKDKIRAERLANRLDAYVMGEADEVTGEKVDLDSTKVAAAKILIDKGKPSLQAVEQTQVNEMDNMSEEELIGMVSALITSNPGILPRLGLAFAPQVVASEQSNEAKKA